MTKLRKQRRKKRYNANVNRKRLRNRVFSVGKINCDEVKNNWEEHKSVKSNFREMGLVYDPNEALKIPTAKEKLKKQIASTTEWTEEKTVVKPTKTFVVEELEKEAKAPRKKMFRLPKSQVDYLAYLIDKYGEDCRAMTRDRRNYNQETWKQLRARIKLFKSIPEQYQAYLMSKIEK